MQKDLNLLDSLIKNHSILIHQKAKDWKEAVKKCLEPLENSGAIEKDVYINSVIKTTQKYGPYYLISDKVAMPHARPEEGALDCAFSLITLENPVTFPNDKRKIFILIGLSSVSADIHVSSALPQVVTVFESPENEEKIKNASNPDEIIKIISSLDLNKYLERK